MSYSDRRVQAHVETVDSAVARSPCRDRCSAHAAHSDEVSHDHRPPARRHRRRRSTTSSSASSELGFKPHVSRGEHRTIIGVIGDENKLQAETARGHPRRRAGAADPEAVQARQPRVPQGRHASSTSARCKIGGGSLAMIAGPCAVESDEVLDDDRRARQGRPGRTSSAAARSSRAPAPTPSRAWARTA